MSDSLNSMKTAECSVCGQPAHGHHFGVLCCRPCIEFYRRSIVKSKTYKCLRLGNCGQFRQGFVRKCKACRYERCQNVGMHLQKLEQKSEEVDEISDGDFPHLWAIKNAFDQFLTEQNAVASKSLTRKNSGRNVDENSWQNLEQATKPMLVRMFENGVEAFAKMELEQKFELVGKCLAQINFLAACHLTIKRFPSANDSRFYVAQGFVVNMTKLNAERLVKREMDESCLSHAKLIQRRFQIVQHFKALSYPPQKMDFAVLAAMLLIIKIMEGPQNGAWEPFKEAILGEWHQCQSMIFGDANAASIQIGRLLSLLPQLDMMIMNESLELAAVLPVEFRSNRFSIEYEPGQHFIGHFSRLLKCHKRIWAHFYAFNDEYFHKFERIEDLLADPNENVLAAICVDSSFAPELDEKNSNLYINASENVETRDFWCLLFKDAYVTTLTTLALMKAMPAYRKIDIQDKILLARQLRPVLEYFIKAFYSVELGAQTWIRPEGLTAIWTLKRASNSSSIKNFGDDKSLLRMADKCFTRPVQRIHEIQPMLDKEEFAFLLAILASNTTGISGLSDYARQLLYADQTIYSRCLLHQLQAKLGSIERGAQRFAECLFLMENFFIACQNVEKLKAYMSAFYGSMHKLNDAFYPKCLQPLTW